MRAGSSFRVSGFSLEDHMIVAIICAHRPLLRYRCLFPKIFNVRQIRWPCAREKTPKLRDSKLHFRYVAASPFLDFLQRPYVAHQVTMVFNTRCSSYGHSTVQESFCPGMHCSTFPQTVDFVHC